MIKGSTIPQSVKDAAQTIQDYLGDEKNELITRLLATPTSLPSFNPDVVVTFDYESYRSGDFTESIKTTLQDYLLVYAANPTLYWYDVLGKHSEINEEARNLSVRWARGDLDDDISEGDSWSFPSEEIRHNDVVVEKLKQAADAFLRKHGPFDTEKDRIPDADEFADIYDDIMSKESYAVFLKFPNAVVEYNWNDFYKRKEKEVQSLNGGFDDAYEAALVYVIRPTVTASFWGWKYYDEDGNKIDNGSKERKVDLSSFRCEYTEELSNTETSYGTDFVWDKTPREQELLDQFRALEDFDPRADFETYIEQAKELVKSKRVKV